jgi:hypothetical protein
MSTPLPNLNDLFNDVVQEGNVQLAQWLFFGFILVGIIIKLMSFNIHTDLTQYQNDPTIKTVGPATGSIWGYSIILFATLGLIFISVNPEKEGFEQIGNIPLSLYAIVIILLWSIILNFRFYNKINTTPVMPKQYKIWANWSTVVIIVLCLLCILEYIIDTVNKEIYKGLKSQFRLFTVVAFFSGMIVMGIQDTILSSFLVDG